MNPNLAEVGKPTRWPPGQSGNPAGKPPGTRTAFSQGFIHDFALVWAEEGLEAVRKVAKKDPEAFVAIAARICPNDVRLTLEQAIPGGMSWKNSLAHARSDCCYQGRLARSRPIAARSGIPARAECAARLFEQYPAHRHRRIHPPLIPTQSSGEKQIGFGGVLVFCNGASISLLDRSIGYQAIESLLFTPVETFGLFHAPPGDDITKDRQFFVGDGDGFSHLALHMRSRPSGLHVF